MNRSKITLTLSVLSLLGMGCVAQAAPQDSRGPGGPPPDGRGPHKPPQEAFDACKSSKKGDACTVDFHGHTMTGTCDAPPDGDGALACRPNGPPPPPPEAVDACAKSKEGDDCTVPFQEDEIDGTCVKMRDTLACRPNGDPPAAG